MITFKEWPKTPRLLRDIVITEKIDGTNAAIGIVPAEGVIVGDPAVITEITVDSGETFAVYAQSRTRLITPGKSTDNYGFAGCLGGGSPHHCGYLPVSPSWPC